MILKGCKRNEREMTVASLGVVDWHASRHVNETSRVTDCVPTCCTIPSVPPVSSEPIIEQDELLWIVGQDVNTFIIGVLSLTRRS